MTQEKEGKFLDMLAWRRPAGSKTERRFIHKFLSPLDMNIDAYGNLYKRIDDKSRVLWSCHTDTVHSHGGAQRLTVSPNGVVVVSDKASNCLGADDTSGVWLMRELILAKKPGLYVFHREEECGMHGSAFIAKKTPELLKDIDIAIALDRRGFDDVITHQAGGRCCSQAFASDLAAALNADGCSYKPSSYGIFTDTASYVDIVPECTNISVGYDDQHTRRENQSLPFLASLRETLLSVDPNKLSVDRDPTEKEEEWYSGDVGAYGNVTGSHWYDRYNTSDWWQDKKPSKPQSRRQLCELIRDYPERIADIAEDYGIDLHEELMRYLG